MQKKKFLYDDDLYPGDTSAVVMVAKTLLLMLVILLFGGLALTCTKQATKKPDTVVQDTHLQLTNAFHKHQSPVPAHMAEACSRTSNPKLLAAVAIVESNGTPWARGKAGEKGAFQVIASDWGEVSDNPIEQAAQADDILAALVERRGSLRCGLASYNGGPKPGRRAYNYADRVLRVMRTI